jgi:hypothetical protein
MMDTKKITDMQAGKAGVHLVCADLILKGHVAFPSEEALPYDIVAEINGSLLRVQVKTTRIPVAIPQRVNKGRNAPVYFFQVMLMGKNHKKRYSSIHNDLFALVSLDRKQIAYVNHGQVKTSMMFRLREYEGQYYGDKFAIDRKKIEQLKISDPTISYEEIGRKLALEGSYVSRVWREIGPPKCKWRYLEDFTLENALDGFFRERSQIETIL